MAQDDSKNLKKYFENDPPSFFDNLTVKEEESLKVSNEVRDIWPYPDRSERIPAGIVCVTTESLTDPITTSMTQHSPSELTKRKQPNLDSLTVDDRGVRTLIDEKCYRGALALISRLLTNYGQGFEQKPNASAKHSAHSLQLWHARIALLLKINEIEVARQEAESFGQLSSPEFFYEHQEPQTFSSKHGSLASFSFRLLLASDLQLRLNKPQDALNNLLKMLETTRKICKFFTDLGKEREANFWRDRKVRVMCAMINTAMQLKNLDLAHQLFQSVLELPGLSDGMKFTVASAWGRAYLLCGDILSAEKTFKLHEPKTPTEEVERIVNRGLIAVAQNDYEEALKGFQKARDIDKENILIINNMSVCHLYTGKMHEAIKLYEQAINHNPSKNISEPLLLNCSTLYELESNDSRKKKIDLLKLVSANRADLELSIESCLKLGN